MFKVGDEVSYYRRHSSKSQITVEKGLILKEITTKYIIENPVKPYTPQNPAYLFRLKENVW